MFLRPCYRYKNGKRHAYWALMESYRTERGPRQRVVAYLGQLDERGRLGVKDAARGRRRSLQKRLFDDVEPQWVEVDAARLRVENSREFGGAWLGLELVRQLGLNEFFEQTMPRGEEHVPWSVMALVLILCRSCEPSSELHVVEHFYAQSGLADLLLHDVTSTYFEGEARGTPLAQRGYSRDHRPDCKQVHARFEQRIEEGLRRIEASCQRQRLDRAVVGQRLGRLLGQNSRAASSKSWARSA